MTTPPVTDGAWMLYFDGACRRKRRELGAAAGAGASLFDATGVNQWTVARYLDSTTHTNNTAEYIALIDGLTSALHHGVRRLVVHGDSMLILQQVQGRYSCNNARLRKLRNKAHQLLHQLDSYELQHVDRLENKQADGLANRALDGRRTRLECAEHGINGEDCSGSIRLLQETTTAPRRHRAVAETTPSTPPRDVEMEDTEAAEAAAAIVR